MIKLTVGLLALVASAATVAQIKVIASGETISVSVNGEPVGFTGTKPQRVKNRVLVPLRGVLEKIGATVDWDSVAKTVIAQRESVRITLRVGASAATVGDTIVNLDVPAMIIGGATMVPLRFMGEALGTSVSYEVAPPPNNAAMYGVWYLLDSNDAFVKTTKITFSKDGKFLFQGSAWKSTGRFEYRPDEVTFYWESVDGAPVKEGSMVKTMPVTQGASRMQLDRFRYGKFS